MNKELFGVFGDRETFENLAADRAFDAVISGRSLTVGVRDPTLGEPGRTSVHTTDDGACAIWGEAFPPDEVSEDTARWLLDRFEAVGPAAFDDLNGSYLAAVDAGEDAVVATDPVRSWECFYADVPAGRVFGSDGAAVGATSPTTTVSRRALLEFLHVGIVLGERTLCAELSRLPADSLLRVDSVASLDRFVYEPTDFEYVDELATRMQRAIERRRVHGARADRTGLMLSGGFDSRTLLSQLDDVDHCYTIGGPDNQEVTGARRLAAQYDCLHTALPPGERYLRVDDHKTRHANGVKESIHAHAAGYDDAMTVDAVYHGLWFDTLIRGYFSDRASVALFGHELPLDALTPYPDRESALLSQIGYAPEKSRRLATEAGLGPADPDAFVRDAVAEEFATHEHQADTIHNHIAATGIGNQPALPFRRYLADNYRESFTAVDAELLEWHLKTPPEKRSTRTFLDACRRIDSDLLRHRPPDRPTDSHTLNTLAGYGRALVPFADSVGDSWPNRDALYRAGDFDARLFPDAPEIHALPPRHKLRIHDARQWLRRVAGERVSASDILDVVR